MYKYGNGLKKDLSLLEPSSYDELYYELNREEKVFTEIHAMGKISRS